MVLLCAAGVVVFQSSVTRFKCRSIADCSRGSLWRDIALLPGVPLAALFAEELRARFSVRRHGPSGTVSSGCHAVDGGTEWSERFQVFPPQLEPLSEMMLRAGVAGQLRLNSLGTVSEVDRRACRIG